MKIIDRYVLVAFLKNYLISFATLVGLFVVMDMVFNFDEFTNRAEGRGTVMLAAGIAEYYFYQGFFVYAQIAGIIPVLAAAFTLMRMSRFNELTALLAAGVPLVRVAMPVIVAAVGINLLVQPINQEIIIPSLIPQITRDRSESLGGRAKGYPVRTMPDGRGGIMEAGRYYPSRPDEPAMIELLTAIYRDESGAAEIVWADTARWDPAAHRWDLVNGFKARNVTASGVAATPAPIDVWATLITPAEIELAQSAQLSAGLGGSFTDLLPLRTIDELLSRPGLVDPGDLLRAKHSRIASHVMNVILILLAIPAVLTRQPGMLRKATFKTFFLVGNALGAVFFFQTLARQPPSPEVAQWWPALMAWMPVFLFGPTAIVLLDRVET